MDADVLTIENSRSGDEMIHQLAKFGYNRDLGAGVYDVHSPVVPRYLPFSVIFRKVEEVSHIARVWGPLNHPYTLDFLQSLNSCSEYLALLSL